MTASPDRPWLSAANRAAGFWMGHAANAVRRQQRAVRDEQGRDRRADGEALAAEAAYRLIRPLRAFGESP
ncbi:hypothetical protein FF100_11860 [Methylobacterium terricola]|uniref:Uncharacterized protein n=1 Tax=Methylobacterium terricola TaxID=2583531 RepID=A0A5C4LLW9_9HYPH|nr:hypothetical protein [Methylobacterium terricola]TNC13482.1 hypothetical protein FF100_11860 [Methylobacterium terricola]